MKFHVHRWLLPAAATLLSACAATPTQFYTLIPPPSVGQHQAAPDAALQIEVLPVEIPLQVDRPQMVVREGGDKIVPVETRQWIAPLATEIRGALSADLTRSLGASDIYGIAATPGVPTYRIMLKVRRFDSALGAYAHIDALWSIRRSDAPGHRITCSSTISQTVPPGYAALAQGHQDAVSQIATQIAARIKRLQDDPAAGGC